MPFEVNENQENNIEIIVEEFFPAIQLSDFKETYSIPSDLQEKMLVRFLKMAAFKVCRELDEFKNSLIAENKIFPVIKEDFYIQAVCCFAKAYVLKETQSIARRDVAENLAKTSEETEDKYNELAFEALNLILEDDDVTIGLC
ncbi:head completion/stabilization protein [Lentisphaerota bacterium WC36G]|nr:head completion/stabilization protein [Lentisphaerae bacterium WC36]